MSITTIWLIAGVLFVAAEALGVNGIGLLFAGLGALVAGSLISLGLIGQAATISQFIVFFIATAAWAALLWKPMQRFRLKGGHQGYKNMIGETGYVGSAGLSKGTEGEVTWSGTIMKAELIPQASADQLDPGSAVVIVEVTGAKLMVKPK